MAIAVKKQLNVPMMLDEDTLLADIRASHNRLIYQYTLVKYNGAEVNAGALTTNMSGSLVKNYCENVKMTYFRENNLTAEYIYFGKDKMVVASILITNANCKAQDPDPSPSG